MNKCNTEQCIENVEILEFNLSSDGTSLSIRISDPHCGADRECSLICSNVVSFDFQRPHDESTGYFVGRLCWKEHRGADAIKLLNMVDYEFYVEDSPYPTGSSPGTYSAELRDVLVEVIAEGIVAMRVICRKAELKK